MSNINIRPIIDQFEWRAMSQASGVISVTSGNPQGTGTYIGEDYRNRDYAHPIFYYQGYTSNYLCNYNIKSDGWGIVQPNYLGMAGTYGQGATGVFCPSFSPNGTITTTSNNTSFTLSTALPASVLANQMINRGDGLGFIVRIVGKVSGKIEERRIIANTAGTTPTVYIDKPFSFIPATGDRYEFLSGSVLFLNTGVLASGIFKRYDILTKTLFTLSTTNLISTIPSTHNQLISTDEQYVPCDRLVGEGYVIGSATYDTSGDFTKGCLLATASSATTLTGQVIGGDYQMVANLMRNKQIRIVEDTITPTAVGQRRLITGNTGGASPVYTVATWTVTPSATCKFVIENCTDNVIGIMGGSTAIYNYKITNYCGGTIDTWDTTTWSARATGVQAGCFTWFAFGVPYMPNANNVISSNLLISMQGGNNNYSILDMGTSATGTWNNNIVFQIAGTGNGQFNATTDYSSWAYNPHTQNGLFCYMCAYSNSTFPSNQRTYTRFDFISGTQEWLNGPKVNSGTNGTSYNKISFITVYTYPNGEKIAFYTTPRAGTSTVDYLQLMITR